LQSTVNTLRLVIADRNKDMKMNNEINVRERERERERERLSMEKD
jgi:hypothetical protein